MRLLLLLSAVWQLAYCQTCDSGWSEHAGSCYYVNSGETSQPDVNWHAAREYCVAQGGELASVHNDAERDFILSVAESSTQNGNIWLGLNQLADREAEYEWSDGTTLGYVSYAPDEPNRDGDNQCIFSKGSLSGECFDREQNVNTVEGLFGFPSDAKPPGTHYFGYQGEPDDPDWCQSECAKEKYCQSYTFISNKHPDYVWKGECMGTNDEQKIRVTDEFAISGVRVECGETEGIWYSDNCGRPKGYACKKTPGAPPATVPPTSTVPGFCPVGWFGLDNKCYKMVEVTTDFEGATWSEARELCRQETGYETDLASFHSLRESAIVVAQLQAYILGLWIGYYQDGGSDPWLWTDNSNPNDWTYWAEGEPSWGNEHCTELLISRQPIGMWNNFPCDEKRGYVCQSYKDSSNPIATPEPTTPHSCPDGYTPHWYGCYKYVTGPASWVSGEQACAQDGGHLASVHAEAENAALFLMTEGSSAWLGFRKGGDDTFRWTDGWPTRYQRWSPGHPDERYSCALINQQGMWNASDCNSEHGYICKTTDVPRPTTPDIGDGACPNSEWKTFGTHCYYFGTAYEYPDYEQYSWIDSLEQCVIKGQGHSHPSSLASVHSWPENEFIYNTLNEIRGGDSYYLTRAWIGLSKKELGSPFVWADGTPFDFEAWMPGEPNDEDGTSNCIEMYVETAPGLWNDHFCSMVSAYVCKTELGEAPTTPTHPPEVPGNCPTSGDWEAYGAQCYLFMPDEYDSWDQAHGQCKGFGGSIANLASIHNSAENYWIQNQLVAKSNMPVRRGAWIGLKKTASDNEWSWIEPGQDLVYQNWAVGQGDPSSPNNCVYIDTAGGLWHDHGCTEMLGYVCRAPKVEDTDEKDVVDDILNGSNEYEQTVEEYLDEEYPAHDEVELVDEISQNHFRPPVPEMLVIKADNGWEQPGDPSDIASIVLSVLGCMLVIAGIIAAVVIVKKTPKKPKNVPPSPESGVATTPC